MGSKGRSHERKPHDKKACRFCGDLIGGGRLEHHEKVCANASPEKRKQRKEAREAAAKLYARQRHLSIGPVNVMNGKKPTPHPQVFMNGNGTGKRLQATISVDLETLRQLLLELAPSFSLDKVTVI
jgi:hypothetical protein